MQQVYPISPSIHSIQDNDEIDEQQGVESYHNSGPITRVTYQSQDRIICPKVVMLKKVINFVNDMKLNLLS